MRLLTILLAVAALAWAAVAAAAPKEPGASGAAIEEAAPKAQPTPMKKVDPGAETIESLGATRPAPGLRKELTIDRSVLERLERREAAEEGPELDAVESAYASFKQARQSFISKARSYRMKLKQCAAQSYTAREQELAGCRGDDTVEECAEKLLRHCSNADAVRLVGARRVLVVQARELQAVVDRVTTNFERL